MRSLDLDQVEDELSRENFRRIKDYLYNFPMLRGQFVFFEMELAAASYPATVSFKHNLGFIPKDVLQTSVIGGTVTWEYSQFTSTHVYATISAAATVRAFIGSYKEGSRA